MGFAYYASNGMFSQRHYQAIAKELNTVIKRYKALEMEWALRPIEDIVTQLTNMFRNDNPNFKEHKFKEAIKWED